MISHRSVLEEGPRSGGNKMQGLLKETVMLLNQNTLRKITWNAPVWQRSIKVHIMVKFVFFKKATKIDEIFTFDLTLTTYIMSNQR